MKAVLTSILISIVASFGFASDGLECANKAVEAATLKNFRSHGANTGSCGAKLLSAGEFLETYLVCTSDETDPAEWVVVMRNAEFRNNRLAAKCVAILVEPQHDSKTPNFESDEGLLKTVECSMSDDDKKPHCR